MIKKHAIVLVSFLALILSFSAVNLAQADEQPINETTAVTLDATAAPVTVSAPVVSTEPESLDGITVQEPKNIPSGFGLWWKNLAENVSLGLTFNPVKKAEKQLQFAAERTKLAEYMLKNSTDPKVQEKAQQLLERANEYTKKLEEKKAELADKNNPAAKRVLENISKHFLNQEKSLDKMEDKIPAEKLEEFTRLRDEAKARAQSFVDKIKNDANVPQEVKDAMVERMNKMQEIQTQRDAFRAQEKTLIDQVKQGNQEAKNQLETLRQDRTQEMEKLQTEFKIKRDELLQKIEGGDKEAVKELEKLNREQRKKAEETKRELEKKAQEIKKEVMQKNGEVRKQMQEKRQELEKKAREVQKEVRQQVKEYRPEPKDNAIPGVENPVQKIILP